MMNHGGLRSGLHSLLLWGMVLISFVFFVETSDGADAHETEILVPVVPYNLPDGLTLLDLSHKEIEVRFSGSLSTLKQLSQDVPGYDLDLSGVAVGIESIPINPDRVQMPEGLKITRVNPAYLTVKIDRWLKRQVPVKVVVSGKPTASYFVESALAKPSSVIICGPETAVSSVDEILTKPIDVSGRSESFKKEIAPDLADRIEICSNEDIILVEIYFSEKIITKTFEDILVEGKNSPFDHHITPPTLTLEIKGPQNIIANLQPQNDIHVSVELENLKPGVYVRRAAISLPVKTTLVNVEPELFTVKIIGDKP